jgi:hypothetical protein
MKVLAILAALAYLLWPYDLLADILPGWGWADDLVVLFFLWRYLRSLKAARHPGSSSGQDGAKGDGVAEPDAEQDPHAVLGVGKNATPEEVNRAYRQLAKKYHPDKVAHLGDEFRKLAEMRFKEIQAAYDKLKRP